MREYVTSALVLSIRSYSERDRIADFYTEQLGRVEARLVSGRKILSRLAPHSSPGNFVRLRLVWKNVFTVADVMTERVFARFAFDRTSRIHLLGALSLVRSLQPPLESDRSLWSFLVSGFQAGSLSYFSLFAFSGYDLRFVSCAVCGGVPCRSFLLSDHLFLCERCGRNVSGFEGVGF